MKEFLSRLQMKHDTQESRDLRKTLMTGRKVSNETREHMSGKTCTSVTRNLISKAHRGKKLSDEHRERISESVFVSWMTRRRSA